MFNKQAKIWIALTTGLALSILLALAGGAAAKFPSPAASTALTTSGWNSGWRSVPVGQCLTLTHSLGAAPENYYMSLFFRDTNGSLGVNRRNYGGLEYNNKWYGAYWQHLTSNTIQICRMAHDTGADQINLRLWIPDTAPDYDSGWQPITAGTTSTFTHNLGITATELSVGLWFSGTLRGIHHYGYGELTVDAPPTLRGAYWHNLTDNAVQVSRAMNDTDIEQVRVLVKSSAPPTYDSGWQPLERGHIITFTHNLSRSANLLLVRGECYSDTVGGPGIHQHFAGGNYSAFGGWQGISIQNLTANTLQIARRANDASCPQVRARIWAPEYKIYLPLTLKN